LLLDRLLAVPGSRVVTVSSIGYRYPAPILLDDLQWERGYNRMGAYGQSKLANLLFTYELQCRLVDTNTIVVAAHPGASRTALSRNTPPWLGIITGPFELIAQSAAMGALRALRAATDPAVVGGQYFGPGGFAELRGFPRVVASRSPGHQRVGLHADRSGGVQAGGGKQLRRPADPDRRRQCRLTADVEVPGPRSRADQRHRVLPWMPRVAIAFGCSRTTLRESTAEVLSRAVSAPG
jgi:NAD(P)-dependent dehydrogenase (short-subunit alcohol dehydrogenase family)